MCPIPLFAQHIPIRHKGSGQCSCPVTTPVTKSAMTNLPGRGWHEAPAMVEAPSVGTPVNTLWGSSPCSNTPSHPSGSSKKGLRWARLDGTAWLPLVYDQGDCFNAIQEEKKTGNAVLVCAVFSPRKGAGGNIYYSTGAWSKTSLWALNATKSISGSALASCCF